MDRASITTQSSCHSDPIRHWAHLHGFIPKRGDKDTHFLLNGGRLSIPRESESDFLQMLADALDDGLDLFVVERRTEVFNMFMDLDLVDKTECRLADILSYIHVIQEYLVLLFPSSDTTAIVCTSPPKNIVKNDRCLVKTGVHCHWPGVRVTSDTALAIRRKLLTKLSCAFGQRPEYNTWAKAIDPAVYRENGLRMKGMKKITPCDCNGACDACRGTGKIVDQRAYSIAARVDPSGNVKYESCDTLKMLCISSIRVYDKPSTLETSVLDLDEEDLEHERLLESDAGLTLVGSRIDVDTPDSQRFVKMLEGFIKLSFPPYEKNLVIKGVVRKGDPVEYCLVDTATRFCLNKNANHRSNRIYFYVTKDLIHQKCFDREDCGNFLSPGKKIPLTLRNFLFMTPGQSVSTAASDTGPRVHCSEPDPVSPPSQDIQACQRILDLLTKKAARKTLAQMTKVTKKPKRRKGGKAA